MPWPRNLPTRDCGPLPDLDGWQYTVAPQDATSPLDRRLQEAERRIVFLEWLLAASEADRRTEKLLNDSFVGVLYTLSAVREEIGVPMNAEKHPLLLRGLIALRHLEVHVRPGSAPSQIYREMAENIRTGFVSATGNYRWVLPEVSEEEWDRLTSAKAFFRREDLGDWGKLTREASVEVHLRVGFRELVKLIGSS